MKIRSGGDQYIYDTKTLDKPDRKTRKLIKKESYKIPLPYKVHFYILNEKPEPFAACAFYGDNLTYSICLSADSFNKNDHYLKWVIRHELRHCVPTKGTPFRYHDRELYDIGFDPPKKIGFFTEDFEEIGNDRKLRATFPNIYRMDEWIEKKQNRRIKNEHL